MIEKYYEEELRYLYESGRQFAKAHPDRARYLNIDAVGDRDPYIERLFEGFAFLVGRVREKLDDSFPELTEGLINLLWPAFLQEIPSVAIVEFKARSGLLQETRILKRGTELLSGPAGPESVPCRFVTTQQVAVGPFALAQVKRQVDTRNRETLTFEFRIEPGVNWQKLKLSSLRLYLHAELPTAMIIHRFLTTRIVHAAVGVDNGRFSCDIDPDGAVSAGGLSQEESLLPHNTRAFWGHMLLLEYFIYPEKFLFIDLNGFDRIPFLEPSPRNISFSVTLDTSFPHNRPFTTENFRLFCSPAVNMYSCDTEPLTMTGKNVEYRICADAGYPSSVKVHSVRSATGIDRTTGERYAYEPFFVFKNLGKGTARTYATHYRKGAEGKRDVWVSVGGNQLTDGQLREETLSIEAWCTNGVIPRDELREGGIEMPGAGFPDTIKFTNITRPTLPCEPPDHDDYLWVFLSHLGATFSSLASAGSLTALLRLYDWSKSEGRARRIASIGDVRMRPVDSMVAGCVVRGIEYTVSLQESEFQDTGDLHLFGEVLKEFLSHYVTINSFLKLVFELKPSGETMTWNTLKGMRWLL